MAKAGRLPYMQLFVDDWLNDIPLSRCSPETRGIWVDVLCQMHREGRTGVMSGEADELARLCRCTPKQLVEAAKELASKGAADVKTCNGVVTFTNRRMAREHKDRENAADRQRKHRQESSSDDPCHAAVTHVVRQRPDIRVSDSQNIRISKNQNSVSQTDVFQTLRKEDLSDVSKLLEILPRFVAAGLIPYSEDGVIRFVAACSRSLRYGKRSPVGLLRTIIVGEKWGDLSNADLEDASRSVRDARRAACSASTIVGIADFGKIPCEREGVR